MEIVTLIYLIFGFGCGFVIARNSKVMGLENVKEEMTAEEKQALESLQKQLEELISYSGGKK